MRKSTKFLLYLCSMPKTLFFNLRCFPLKIAMKLPVFICYDVYLGELHKNIVKIDAPITRFMIKFGIGGVAGIDSKRSQLWLQKGNVTFKGKATFAKGSSIRNNGELIFGNCFSGGKNTFISCTKQIVFGNDVLMGWNCSIRDSDGHVIFYSGEPQEAFKPVYIGNHVWLAAESHVLKGVTIMDNSVVAYRSLDINAFDKKGLLIGGSPAKMIKESVSWER